MPEIIRGAVFDFGGTLCRSSLNERRLEGLFHYARETVLELRGRDVAVGLVTVAEDYSERLKQIKDYDLTWVFGSRIEIIDIPSILRTKNKDFGPMIARLEVDPSKCIIVGDMPKRDVAGALAVGAISVLSTENTGRSNTTKFQADLTIPNIASLIPTLITHGYLLP